MGLHLPSFTNIMTDVGHGFKAAGDLGSYVSGAITGNNQAQANAAAAYTNIGKAPSQQFTPAQNINATQPKPNLLQRGIGDVGGFVGGLAQLPVQFSEDWSNTFANLGTRAAGGHNQTIQQNMGGDPFSNQVLRFSGATGKNAQLAGDAAQIGIIAATGGAEAPVAAAGDRLATQAVGDAAPQIIRTLAPKVGALGARTVLNSTSGATLNAVSAATNGANFKQTLNAAKQGAEAGAIMTVAPAVVKGTVNAAKSVKMPSEVANGAATEYSGLHPKNVVNDNEAGTLSDYADTKTLNAQKTGKLYNPDIPTYNKLAMQARNAANTAGIDITSGSDADISGRIADYLERRDTHLSARNSIMQGGYIGDGGLTDANGNPIPKREPLQPSTQRPQGELQKQIEEAHNAGNTELEAQLNAQLQDQAMSSTPPPMTAERRAELMAKMRGSAAETTSKTAVTPEEEAMGKALGMTPEEVANAKADMSPSQQMEMKAAEGDANATKAQRTLEENIRANPYRDLNNISEVNPGDYEKARANAQQASNPVLYNAELAGAAADRAGLTWNQLTDMVEGKTEPKTAAERTAVELTKSLYGRALATTHSLGGNTETRSNYSWHNVDLPDEVKSPQGGSAGSETFNGINNMARKYATREELNNAGYQLEHGDEKASVALNEYGKRAANALRRQALFKGFTEADRNPETGLQLDKTHSVDIGGLKNIQLSEQGAHEIRSFAKPTTQQGIVGKAYDKANSSFKQVLLTLSQFHPINISVLKAGPALALRGHPLLAAKGVFDTFATELSPKYSEAIQRAALNDGTVEAGARMGTPIKFGSDYAAEGKLSLDKMNLPERAIFDRAMPAMQIQMVKGAMADLGKRNIPLDAPEARAVGTRINEIMGFVNQEVRNLNPATQKIFQKIFLAPQFTRAKWATVKSAATEGGLGGSYARRAVVGNGAAVAAVSLLGAALVGQKSDDAGDIIKRAIFHPSIPTPFKDKKGNTIELDLPATYTSEVLNVMGFKLNRGNDGHLQVSVSPGNIPSNLENYGQSRLAVLPSAGLKVVTNQNYAGKPLYDPNASTGTQIAQGGTTLLTGLLPIGLQGVAYSNAVDKHLPQSVQQVLAADSPGSNPFIKSVGSSFGLTPRTDKTTGQGLQSTQYFDALDQAKKGLNRQEQDAMDVLTGSKKNPVTGAYDINKSVYDTPAKANLLLQNPKVLEHLTALNQQLKKEGQSVDPLYDLPEAAQVAYLQHETMLPGSAEATQWSRDNAGWYDNFTKARSAYFDSLPAGDPNRPKDPIPYPEITGATQSNMDTYSNISDATQKAQFLDSHPDVSQAFSQISNYNNAIRTARGAAALKNYPEPDAQTQKDLTTYDSLTDKSAKSAFIKAHPNVTDYFTQVSLYGLEGEAALDRFQGNSPSQKELKDIYNLGNYDVVKNNDGSYSLGSAFGSSNSNYGTGSKYNDYGFKNLSGYYSTPNSVARGVANVTKYPIQVPKALRYTKVTRGMRTKFHNVRVSKGKSGSLKAKVVKSTV
jgi:hypothetical protein